MASNGTVKRHTRPLTTFRRFLDTLGAARRENEALNMTEIVYLRLIDEGTDNECWVVCAKGDPGAVAFVPA